MTHVCGWLMMNLVLLLRGFIVQGQRGGRGEVEVLTGRPLDGRGLTEGPASTTDASTTAAMQDRRQTDGSGTGRGGSSNRRFDGALRRIARIAAAAFYSAAIHRSLRRRHCAAQFGTISGTGTNWFRGRHLTATGTTR